MIIKTLNSNCTKNPHAYLYSEYILLTNKKVISRPDLAEKLLIFQDIGAVSSCNNTYVLRQII